MAQFAYSFCISMLHSFWQSALLGLCYWVFVHLYKQSSPLSKRNFLFVATCLQAIAFVFTFCIYFFSTQNSLLPFSFSIVHYLPAKNILVQTTNWLFALYCLLLFYKVVTNLYSFIYLKKNYSTTLQKPLIDVRLFATQKAFHLGIKKKISVWYSSAVSTPITFGFFKPIILLPISLANNISLQQTETLLLHELAHIKANDYILNWVTVFIETIFFFNPFIIALCSHLKLQRELHCDSTVLGYHYSPIVYAETLLLAAQHNKQMPIFSLGATSSKKQLLKRILFFTDAKNTFSAKNNPLGLVLFLAVYLLLFFTTLQFTLPTKLNSPSAKEVLLFPELGVETNLSFVTTPVLPKEVKLTVENKQQFLPKKQLLTQPQVKNAIETVDNSLTTEAKIIPVRLLENKLPTQQIIIEEEQSGSNKPSVLMVYNLVVENDQWVLQPQFMISKIKQDTTKKLVDSTIPFTKLQMVQ
jgi:beta-lactamase regulating signal transducer with metallopeptidase domain